MRIFYGNSDIVKELLGMFFLKNYFFMDFASYYV